MSFIVPFSTLAIGVLIGVTGSYIAGKVREDAAADAAIEQEYAPTLARTRAVQVGPATVEPAWLRMAPVPPVNIARLQLVVDRNQPSWPVNADRDPWPAFYQLRAELDRHAAELAADRVEQRIAAANARGANLARSVEPAWPAALNALDALDAWGRVRPPRGYPQPPALTPAPDPRVAPGGMELAVGQAPVTAGSPLDCWESIDAMNVSLGGRVRWAANAEETGWIPAVNA